MPAVVSNPTRERRMGGLDGDSHIDPTRQGPQRETDTTRSPDARRVIFRLALPSQKGVAASGQAHNLQLTKSRDV